jgi:hypothetical protein
MQTLQWFSRAFRKKVDIGNRCALSVARMSPSELTGDLERQLYGMSRNEQSIVKQVLTMPGEAVLVRQDTFAIDKKNKLCPLEKGRQVRISENPLTLDRQGDARINILDESDKPLSMRLSDYIEDICANH